MIGYLISCVVLALILAAFIPAMIAANKDYRFVKWYVYALVLFPVALVHSLKLKKPVRIVNVFSEKSDRTRVRKRYKKVSIQSRDLNLSFRYIAIVFLTKFLFSGFLALVAYAIMRSYNYDTLSLRITAVIFCFVMTVFLSITEIAGFSRITVFADELTKRALYFIAASALASLPMFIISRIITGVGGNHIEFYRFLCTLISFVLLVSFVLRLQSRFYGKFYRFFDYCVLSIFSYGMYSAVMVVLMTISDLRIVANALSMPMYIFDFSYFSDVKSVSNFSGVHLAVMANLLVCALIFISGLLCKNYKKKELLSRVEYRTKAFRMSKKRTLRRHIAGSGREKATPLR